MFGKHKHVRFDLFIFIFLFYFYFLCFPNFPFQQPPHSLSDLVHFSDEMRTDGFPGRSMLFY